MNQIIKQGKKTLVGILGGLILIIGIIMIPYPGPGWAVVFLALGLLATEFAWARQLLRYIKSRYDAWVEWLKHQNVLVRLGVLLFTGIVVIVTIWLLNGYGVIDSWLGLGMDWVHSPIMALEFLEH